MRRWRQVVDPGQTIEGGARADPGRQAAQADPGVNGRLDARPGVGRVEPSVVGLAVDRVVGLAVDRVVGLAVDRVVGLAADHVVATAESHAAVRADRPATGMASVDGPVDATTPQAEVAARRVAIDLRDVNPVRVIDRRIDQTVDGPQQQGAAVFGPVRREDRAGPGVIELRADARGTGPASAGPPRVVVAIAEHPVLPGPTDPVPNDQTAVASLTALTALIVVSPRIGVSPRIAVGGRIGVSPSIGVSPQTVVGGRIGVSPSIGVSPQTVVDGPIGVSPSIGVSPQTVVDGPIGVSPRIVVGVTRATSTEPEDRIGGEAPTEDSAAVTAPRTNARNAASRRSRTSRPFRPTSTPGCCIEPFGPNSAACPKNWPRSWPPTW